MAETNENQMKHVSMFWGGLIYTLLQDSTGNL